MTRPFIQGLDLSELFYNEAVKPLLEDHFPDLPHSAGLFGEGSEVLGFDTPQSMDHDWGPWVKLFLSDSDFASYQDDIDRVLSEELPHNIRGYPTNYDQHEDGSKVMVQTDQGTVTHNVQIHPVIDYFKRILNFDPTGDIQAADWVSVPENRYLMLTAGGVFYDGLGQVGPIRTKLRYYPDEVWFYILATQWRRLAQEEAFMGRCGQVGDELGSRLIAARLVRDLMRLCFLMERQYTPYIKWFGTAFAKLTCAHDLAPIFGQIFDANGWETRQTHLTEAYEYLATQHNSLGITKPIQTTVSPFYKRPFLVIHADRFVDALRAEIKAPEILALPEHLGAYDQFIDLTDAERYLNHIKGVYRGG